MNYKIAYQLYSSRNFPPLFSQFPPLKRMGYDAIEPWLPAYEAGAKPFRQALDGAGLTCIGFHMPLDGLRDEPNKFIDIALELGAKYMIAPYIDEKDRIPTVDFWKSIGDDLAAGAEKAAKHDLQVAWHNHDFEFLALNDGSLPIDHILGQNDNVKFQIDIGWIARSGKNPADFLKKFKQQIVSIQLKDTQSIDPKVIAKCDDDGWAATGDGVIDWEALAPLFKNTNADHICAEHDNPADWQKFAQRSIDYMKTLEF